MIHDIIRIHETISTNAWMAERLRNNNMEEGCFVIADYQTGGRGQGINTWESALGKNLIGSILLKPDFLPPSLQFHISRVIALGCFDALSAHCDHLSLKWPNDIYYQNKKLGGILIENSLIGNIYGSCIAGIGINLNQTKFLSNAPNPVSLQQIIGKETNIHAFAVSLQMHLMNWYTILKSGNTDLLEDHYLKRLFRNTGKWPFSKDGHLFQASIETVETDGKIVLNTDNGLEKFWFKEVEFVID